MAFHMRPILFVQFCTSQYAKTMCADIDKTVGLANIDMEKYQFDISRNKRYLTKRKLVTLKSGDSSATFDLSQYEQFDKLEMKLQNESLKTIADRSDFKLLYNSNGIFQSVGMIQLNCIIKLF